MQFSLSNFRPLIIFGRISAEKLNEINFWNFHYFIKLIFTTKFFESSFWHSDDTQTDKQSTKPSSNFSKHKNSIPIFCSLRKLLQLGFPRLKKWNYNFKPTTNSTYSSRISKASTTVLHNKRIGQNLPTLRSTWLTDPNVSAHNADFAQRFYVKLYINL